MSDVNESKRAPARGPAAMRVIGRQLQAMQRRAPVMLAGAGRNGVTAAIMLANGFKIKMLAHLDREGAHDNT
jgi:hypothetical protein